MRVGFTGTREGMTEAQQTAFAEWLRTRPLDLFRHGCCVGADEQAARIFGEVAIGRRPVPAIFGHPSDIASLTSEVALGLCDDTAQPEPPLTRNRDIVGNCDILVACPKGPEVQRSGTWSTIRYALKVGRPVVVIRPNGAVEKATTIR